MTGGWPTSANLRMLSCGRSTHKWYNGNDRELATSMSAREMVSSCFQARIMVAKTLI